MIVLSSTNLNAAATKRYHQHISSMLRLLYSSHL